MKEAINHTEKWNQLFDDEFFVIIKENNQNEPQNSQFWKWNQKFTKSKLKSNITKTDISNKHLKNSKEEMKFIILKKKKKKKKKNEEIGDCGKAIIFFFFFSPWRNQFL